MRARRWLLSIVLAAVMAAPVILAGNCPSADSPQAATRAAAAPAQEKGGQEEFGPYEPVANWPQPLPDGPDGLKHAEWTWGSAGDVYAETPDRVWIAQRGELPLPPDAKPWTPYGMLVPTRGNATGNDDGMGATCEPAKPRGWQRRYHHDIFIVDRNGKVTKEFPELDKLFDMPCGRGPHKLKISPYDPEKHVWVIDDQLHVIYKMTQEGKVVLTLGTRGKRGREAGVLFDRPTDIAWLPDGTFFITDGYGGVRVAKFDKTGKFLMEWGQAPKDPKNPGPNEWNTVHAIAISTDRRLFIADRGHRRMQVFDENGKFIEMWTLGVRSSPYAHIITKDGFLWVSDGGTNRILKYDLNGHYLYGWGAPGGLPGQFNGPHSVRTDQEGNLYVAEVFGGRIQKFRPKPGADPAKVVGQELRYQDSR